MTVDSADNVIVTGYAPGPPAGNQYVTVKYSATGALLWTNSYSGRFQSSAYPSAVKVDASDNVIVTGSVTMTNGTSPWEIATVKYSSAGVPLWTNRFNNNETNSYPVALALDHRGNVIVAGPVASSPGKFDFVVIKYICVPSPILSAAQDTNGDFQIRVDNVLQPGVLVIQSSTNPPVWDPVFTNSTPTNVVFYTCPGATHLGVRFFRAIQSP